MKYFRFVALFIIALIFGNYNCYTQEIKANVVVNTDLLGIEAKQYVLTLEDELKRYINNQKFLNQEWEGEPIPVDINIYLTGGSNYRFSARMVVVSRRYLDNPEGELTAQIPALKITETTWNFEYSYGATLTYNPLRFDPFVSVIDYYMFLAIGFDLDSYEELGGTVAFEQAKNLVQLGAAMNVEGFQTYSEPGALTKYNLVRELTDPRYFQFRKLVFSYYVDGFDKIAFDKETAMKNIENVILSMAKFKQEKIVEASVLLQLFFDAHSQTIATLFNGYSNPELFKALMYLDPGHSMLYQDAMDGKLK
jgi:hypothetical protein